MQYAYPLLAIFIWAGNTVVNKLAVGSIFPAEIGFYRWLLAGLLFTPFMLKPVIANWSVIRPNLGKIFILGVLGMALMTGIKRGLFSNEAGMGSAAITAAAATTDNPVRQGYINMTGTFWDTIVVCTITGLAIASSGVLGMTDAAGNMLTGSDVTIAAFETVLGSAGGWLVTIGITLFAFSTILGWEYHGEKAFEYLLGTHRFNMVYRLVFSFVVYFGCTQTLNLVWSFSDIANALMAIPNLICMLLLSGEIAKDIREFQKKIHKYN